MCFCGKLRRKYACVKALFKVETHIRNFCLGAQNLKQSPTRTLVWKDKGRLGLAISDSAQRVFLLDTPVFSVSGTQRRCSFSQGVSV